MTKYAEHFSPKQTNQMEPIPGEEHKQVKNHEGGYVYKISSWKQLDRFLILGCEGGSYYASEEQMTVDNAKAVIRCLEENPNRVIGRVVEISESRRAPKNDPALFVLALAASAGIHGNREAVASALAALPKVARTASHLFQFLSYVKEYRGWGRGLRKAVASWYNEKPTDNLVYQVLKYRNRYGFTHRDVLRLAHPVPPDTDKGTLYKWITHSDDVDPESVGEISELLRDFLQLQEADIKKAVRILRANKNLTWEMLPSHLQGSKQVWRVLIPNLPIEALLRNLGRLAHLDLLKPGASTTNFVADKLENKDLIHRSRIHPFSVLRALLAYSAGYGVRGSLSWEPCQAILAALDTAFRASFVNVEKTGKRILLAVDTSFSMTWDLLMNVPRLTPRAATGALAIITKAVEGDRKCEIISFSTKAKPINITSRSTIREAKRAIEECAARATDCAAPILWAEKRKIPFDAIVIYTDNETFAGKIHPSQALRRYRKKFGLKTKLIVVAMTSTGFSIADPDDPGMLDIVGFDSATPQLISEFIRMED